MTGQPRKARPRRTFSAFGDVRRMPSEYEIVTHGQNWTMRANRPSAFEHNPSSPPNLWFLTYRENSPLKAEDWEQFRDPDSMTYKTYVNLQAEAETKTAGVLEEFAEANADSALTPGQVALLGSMFTPSRYLLHGCQQVEAYIGYMAPTSYVTNAASFATADYLRRVTLTAYRTRELQLAHPDSGIGTAERGIWENDEAWQPARQAIEKALIAYDWGEAFTALNLVLAPTIDDVLVRQFTEVSRDNGDQLSWLLLSFLQADNDRRNRWSAALAGFCLQQKPENADVLRRWIARWTPVADAAAHGLGRLLETRPEHGRAADEVAAGAKAAREAFHARLFEGLEAAGEGKRAG
ncbi:MULTISPECIES: ferritin family protein [Pseudonocardiaceae]|uniref:propane 2-monooxygenase n=5 Tax=Pseudonocardiaceae TaxID=2070 RepID=A0A8E1WA20_9PSEU|nr:MULTISPECIES: toluene hydroxylase [Pseudonocardiaceae]AEA23068.1 methane/phenol/toluene hydroxylase [Pseudonocardia dioxanivorans CB1190]AIJ26199.1 methane/phenol/toluene hydroxylase [Amycolatopsis methanolica 239]MBB2506293.1 toluene hydroxylase [Amycolatopsis echigonensis]